MSRVTHLSVQNFKGLREISVPLSRFVCLIGENNAGKSSFLQALLLFVDGKKLESSLYFDPNLPVLISVRFENVSESDLDLIVNEEHRSRFREMLVGDAITLVRRYETGGTSRLRRIARVPLEERFKESSIDTLLKSKKPSSAFANEIASVYPEITAQLDSKTNQTTARALIDKLVRGVPDEQKEDFETDLPAGIDNTIRPILPEPIYISAVKDFADEIATKDSASFGKLLGILLNQIGPALEQAEQTFKVLRQNLNRIDQADGSVLDGRLDAVKNIEMVVQEYVRENFPKVELDIRIPPPEIKTVLSGAEIWVNDGVRGLIESKGDGLRRTVTFSILRAYVELRRLQKLPTTAPAGSSNYLFLFEEPELYLHPAAQGILFAALNEISKTNHVVVTTHSPLFFGPDATGTFIKLTKASDSAVAHKPFTKAHCVDLSGLDDKSRFQIISYETNNNAFFYNKVVLVEGDSELLVLPHFARMLNEDWTTERAGVGFCKLGGKGNISRYREFFKGFEVQVCIVGDLDCVLEGFEQLDPSVECLGIRERLFVSVDRYAEAQNVDGIIRSKDIRDMQQSTTRQNLFKSLVEVITKHKDGKATAEEIRVAEEQFFSDRITSKRRQVLEQCDDPEILELKRDLLRRLRDQDVFILERGTIEKYYPDGVNGVDKPSKAIDVCARTTSREHVTRLCDNIVGGQPGDEGKEFAVIFSAIFVAD
jgi:putative ATP-dependent endonuclease of OLD family